VNKLQLPGVELTEVSPHKFVVAVIVVLALACLNLYIENRNLRVAVAEFDNRYIEFLNLKLKDGSHLSSKVLVGSVGVFKIKDQAAACAILKPS